MSIEVEVNAIKTAVVIPQSGRALSPKAQSGAEAFPAVAEQVADPPLSPTAGRLNEFPAGIRKSIKPFVIAVLVLCLAYAKPIYTWAKFALGSELYSHVLLIPFVAVYFAWKKRGELREPQAAGKAWAMPSFMFGLALFAGYWFGITAGVKFTRDDTLCLWVLSFLGFLYGLGIWHFGTANFRRMLFPAFILICASPFPSRVLEAIETLLQHGSTLAAHALFWISGTPFLREGTFFQLPGMPLHVAPECSGIHSSLVLFITSLVAGQVFLRSGWSRAILALAVIPLALLRNGFRIFTIGELCVHIGPQMIDSPIHRRGGPIFFALSLIPFFLLLLWMIRRERRIATTPQADKQLPT